MSTQPTTNTQLNSEFIPGAPALEAVPPGAAPHAAVQMVPPPQLSRKELIFAAALESIVRAPDLAGLATPTRQAIASAQGEACRIRLQDALSEWFIGHSRLLVDDTEAAGPECVYAVDSCNRVISLGESGKDAACWRLLTGLGFAVRGTITSVRAELIRNALDRGLKTPLRRWSHAKLYEDGLWVYVSNGPSQLVRVSPQGALECLPNGQDGVFFVAPQVFPPWNPTAEPVPLSEVRAFSPSLGADSLIDGYDAFTQIALTRAFVLSRIARLGNTPVLVCQGAPGSGKTTLASAVVKLFSGAGGEVSMAPNDPRDFLANAAHQAIYALDNVETIDNRMVDVIARYVTGQTFSARRLYSDNSLCITRGFAQVAITSVNGSFLRQEMAQRAIPVMHARPLAMRDTAELLDEVLAKRDGLLTYLCQLAAKSLNPMPVAPASDLRFSNFALLVAGSLRELGHADKVPSVLTAWKRAVFKQAIQGEPIAEIIIHYVSKPMEGKAAQLLDQLRALAPNNRALETMSPEALGKALSRLASVVEEYGVRVEVIGDRHGKTNTYRIVPLDG